MDFLKAAQSILEKDENPVLELITLAPSGGGKSFLAGTSGMKTLYIHGLGENHGYKSARIPGGDLVLPFCWDLKDDGTPVDDADEAFSRVISVLDNTEALVEAGIKMIVIDGATEMEALIKKTTRFINAVTDKGRINSFKEPAATLSMFNDVMIRLKAISRNHNISYNLTCILDVRELDDNGAITDSTPKLYGYHVAEGLIQQFPDIVVVSRLRNPETDEYGHRVQFMVGVSKTSKEESGKVKKTTNFVPRLTGIALEDLPKGSIAADLKEVIKLKTGV